MSLNDNDLLINNANGDMTITYTYKHMSSLS